MRCFPDTEIVGQSCEIRAFGDEEFSSEGVSNLDDLSDGDILFGIKEARIETFISGKKYEHIVDEKRNRVYAFGWWAGAVGVYYSLREYVLGPSCSTSLSLTKRSLWIN